MSTFANKVLCVGLRTSCLGTSVKDQEATAEVTETRKAKSGKYKVSKQLYGESLKALKKNRGDAGRWFRSMTLPGISEDLRITVPSRLAEIQTRVKEFQDKDTELVAKLKARWYDIIDADRRDLGDGFDPNNYPAPENLEQFFRINLTVTDVPQGDFRRVQGLTQATIDEMAENHQRMLVQIGNQARNEVMSHLAKLIGKISDRLSDPAAERFHDGLFDNLHEYLRMVPELNITGDPQLELLRKEAAEKLNFTTEQVKKYQVLKEQAAQNAKKILSSFGNMGTGRKLVA